VNIDWKPWFTVPLWTSLPHTSSARRNSKGCGTVCGNQLLSDDEFNGRHHGKERKQCLEAFDSPVRWKRRAGVNFIAAGDKPIGKAPVPPW